MIFLPALSGASVRPFGADADDSSLIRFALPLASHLRVSACEARGQLRASAGTDPLTAARTTHLDIAAEIVVAEPLAVLAEVLISLGAYSRQCIAGFGNDRNGAALFIGESCPGS